MVCTMLAKATSGAPRRGRRAASTPSGTPNQHGDRGRHGHEHDVLAGERRAVRPSARPEVQQPHRYPPSGSGARSAARRAPRVEQRPHPRVRGPGDGLRLVAGNQAALVEDADACARGRAPRPCRASRSRRSCAGWTGFGRTRRASRARVIGSSEPNGSSISRMGGSTARARATPARWRCPPERSAGHRSANSVRGQADQRQTSSTRASIRPVSQPTSRGTRPTFWPTVMWGKSPTSCNT